MKYSITIALLFFFTSTISAQVSGNPPAQTIPPFTFFRFDNTPFANKDLPKGKMIFFMFVDPDCDHCQHAMKAINEQFSSFAKTTVIIISMFEQNRINQFMSTYGSNLKGKRNVTILQDKQQQFITRFKPVRYPSMFVYSAQSKLLDYEDNPESVFRIVNVIKGNGKL